jgi:ribosomal protein S18 acetylase RimI-like enzyme
MVNENIKIRKAKVEDLNEIVKIFINESSKKPYNEKFNSKTALKQTKDFFKKQDLYVAKINKEIAGFMVVHIDTDNKKKATINELWLKPKYQGKGFGKGFVNFILDKYKEKGVKIMRLVSHKKSKAFGFYNKMGFNELNYLVFMERKIK